MGPAPRRSPGRRTDHRTHPARRSSGLSPRGVRPQLVGRRRARPRASPPLASRSRTVTPPSPYRQPGRPLAEGDLDRGAAARQRSHPTRRNHPTAKRPRPRTAPRSARRPGQPSRPRLRRTVRRGRRKPVAGAGVAAADEDRLRGRAELPWRGSRRRTLRRPPRNPRRVPTPRRNRQASSGPGGAAGVPAGPPRRRSDPRPAQRLPRSRRPERGDAASARTRPMGMRGPRNPPGHDAADCRAGAAENRRR